MLTAERFAQRAFDLDLIDAHQLESVWGEFGSRDVPLEALTGLLVRKELLTNFQVERILGGKREGYFYGQYKVLYMVGAGTFARVYRAAKRDTGKICAVKVLRQRYVDDLVTRDQFMREAKMVMPLRHPNIVPIFEVEEDRGRPYMVMDFVEGQNLRDFIKVRKKLDMCDSVRLTMDVASGLDYAMKHGVTHRDLKLSNVLVSSRGRARLVDFGLAAISADMSEDAIANAPNPRSIDYAGLERATGVRKNDPRSDIFFAGCMLYHMLSGKAPLHETRDRIQRLSVSRYREIKPVSSLEPDLPNYVSAIVNRSMEFKPERRIQNPADLLAELRNVMRRLDAGDPGRHSESDVAADDPAAADVEAEVEFVQEGESRTVMIVEPNVEAHDPYRKSLKKRGYRVLLTTDPERALTRFEEHREPEPLADCVVINSQQLGQLGVEVFNRLGQMDSTAETPAILLVDPLRKDLMEAAHLNGHRVLLSLPVTVKKLRGALLKLLGGRESTTA